MRSILVLNSGSSTIKFSIFAVDEQNKTINKTYTGLIDNITTDASIKIKDCQNANRNILEKNLDVSSINDPYENAINEILCWVEQHDIQIIAAGHRVAHGGASYAHAVPIDADVLTNLSALSHLAPLHQPYNLQGYKILHAKFPSILQVACFDTSFHTTCNKLSQLFAIPKKLTEQGIRRYGFHGLSYEYIVTQLDKYLPQDKATGKIIIAHLGQGASMCAIDNKTSVATTLSFSAVDGLPMGTRCGNIDPGVILHLMTNLNMSVKDVETLIYKESGLLGVSGGISSDMRVLLNSDSPDAKLAVDLFVYKIGAWIGMLAAELGGLDGLIFTAGIGENAPYIREKICEKASWLGVIIDKEKNANGAGTISTENSKITVNVIPTDEELTIAKNVLGYLNILNASRISGLAEIDPSSLACSEARPQPASGVYGVIHEKRGQGQQQSCKPKCEGYICS